MRVPLFHTNQALIKSIITVLGKTFPPSVGFLLLGSRQNVQLLCLSFPTTYIRVIKPPLEVSITPWCLYRRMQRKALQEPEIINKASKTLPPMLQQTTSPLDLYSQMCSTSSESQKTGRSCQVLHIHELFNKAQQNLEACSVLLLLPFCTASKS